jgi:hypothetical protein
MMVLSLFDGMSCGQIALNRIGIKPEIYYAAEVDNHAVKVTQANYPETVQLGDVTKWREWDINWASIDLLIGGSPCQGFSFAGNQLAFDDPRSKLLFVYVDILNHIRSVNPNVKYMLENVKMKKEHLAVISEHLGVEPTFINSSICSPCDRPRYYWASWSVSQPTPSSVDFLSTIGNDVVKMPIGWHSWFEKNRQFQLKKSYSKICNRGDKGVCMTTRQYASWNGNFIELQGEFYKPNNRALSRLVGAPASYLDSVSQRKAEELTGNGWTVDVISHIFSQM